MTFLRSSSYLQTAESVTEGHPDKLCDQVSDAVLDAILKDDPGGRVACETATTTGLVVVMGEITTETYVDIGRVVREVVRDVGYTNADYGFDFQTCGVMVSIKEQSLDIAAGVDVAYELRGEGGDDGIERLGAGDQGIMIGFACNETPELMPLPIALSHRLAKRLAEVRKDGSLPYLRPDGKSQVVIEYDRGKPVRLSNITLAAQHDPEVSNEALERDLTELVIRPTVPRALIDNRTTMYINASGRFVTGGPMGDAGLTGRKILVDTYGGGYRHGGGAFSGKDPTKVDRSGAYAARYVAKNVVAAGLADRCEVQLAYV
ncbi:MAG: methionine adenosyltransferase, partial [Dehalococcoidia bacterium]|nr:methionine adenosyltransferase [Dehalococcoidia bacterium]